MGGPSPGRYSARPAAIRMYGMYGTSALRAPAAARDGYSIARGVGRQATPGEGVRKREWSSTAAGKLQVSCHEGVSRVRSRRDSAASAQVCSRAGSWTDAGGRREDQINSTTVTWIYAGFMGPSRVGLVRLLPDERVCACTLCTVQLMGVTKLIRRVDVTTCYCTTLNSSLGAGYSYSYSYEYYGRLKTED